jgi:hypothetical protein
MKNMTVVFVCLVAAALQGLGLWLSLRVVRP